jgi:asparagine synthase (glutamine-hydrolysing)
MCGFAGEFAFAPARAEIGRAEKMASLLAHRGPDEAGSFLSADGACAMGFRRLAVIDPPGSHQPMTSADGQVTVSLNGEIYNFRDLRRELADDGVRFRSAGDTEVLLELYRRDEANFVSRLEGMFAFAIYDARRQALTLGRDRLGQKPLWYARLRDRVVFASEAKALLAHELISPSVNMSALAYYLSLAYIPAPMSAWQGVRKLCPSHLLCIAPGSWRQLRYWRPAPRATLRDGAEAIERVRYEVTAAVRRATVSDVPVGVLLSGGLDSAVVAAAMASAAGGAGGIRTFTAGFEGKAYDERAAARRVAARLGTEHTDVLVSPRAHGAVEEMLSIYDEPFADSSALPTWLVCREARRHVTVALTGDGGDEVFAGYDRYRGMHLASTMGPAGAAAMLAASWLARPFARGGDRTAPARLRRFAETLHLPPAAQYLKLRALFAPDDLNYLLSPDLADDVRPAAPGRWFCELYESGEWDDECLRSQAHDMQTYLPDDLLVKTDRASMASSLELRAPLLDSAVVDLGLSLPLALRLSGRRGKMALRRAFADVLPRGTLTGPKRGFGVPLAKWLRTELRSTLLETLTDPALGRIGVFREEAIAGLVNDHLGGRDDHSHRLWALLVLARWLIGNA